MDQIVQPFLSFKFFFSLFLSFENTNWNSLFSTGTRYDISHFNDTWKWFFILALIIFPLWIPAMRIIATLENIPRPRFHHGRLINLPMVSMPWILLSMPQISWRIPTQTFLIGVQLSKEDNFFQRNETLSAANDLIAPLSSMNDNPNQFNYWRQGWYKKRTKRCKLWGLTPFLLEWRWWRCAGNLEYLNTSNDEWQCKAFSSLFQSVTMLLFTD